MPPLRLISNREYSTATASRNPFPRVQSSTHQLGSTPWLGHVFGASPPMGLGSTPWLSMHASLPPPAASISADGAREYSRASCSYCMLLAPGVRGCNACHSSDEACGTTRKNCTRHIGHASSIIAFSRFFLFCCGLPSAILLCLAGCRSSHADCVLFATGH